VANACESDSDFHSPKMLLYTMALVQDLDINERRAYDEAKYRSVAYNRNERDVEQSKVP